MAIERGSNRTIILIPEQIGKIDWIVFSPQLGAPFNLEVVLDPYIFGLQTEARQLLISSLLDPSIMEPYYRWQFVRRVVNPWWVKGSGFEGHLIGMSKEEALKILQEQEKYLIESAKNKGFGAQLNRFIHHPNEPINLELAIHLKADFEKILAQMRAIRARLQQEHPENRAFQDSIYQQIISPSFENRISLSQNALTIGFAGLVERLNITPRFKEDIRHRFPHLAEIGRLGFPPLRILLYYLSINHQI